MHYDTDSTTPEAGPLLLYTRLRRRRYPPFLVSSAKLTVRELDLVPRRSLRCWNIDSLGAPLLREQTSSIALRANGTQLRQKAILFKVQEIQFGIALPPSTVKITNCSTAHSAKE